MQGNLEISGAAGDVTQSELDAVADAQFIVAAADGELTAERVATDTATVAWDFGTAAQAKANVPDDAITFAKIQNIATDRLLGRDTASSGNTEEISVGGGVEFTGSTSIQTSAFTGDVTKAAGGTALTIANDAVTYAKMQNVSAAARLLGRGSAAGSGDPEELTIGSGLSLSGTALAASTQTSTLLDGSIHTDTVAATVSRGSIPYGNATPKWDELVVGAANRVLRSDGTDPSWAQVALTTDVTGVLPTANGGFGPPFSWWSTAFESSTRAVVTNTGGGAATFGSGGMILDTSATGTSSTVAQPRVINATNNGGVFVAFPGIFGCSFFVDGLLGTDLQTFHGLGLITITGSGVTYTSNHIGFKVTRVASGTTSVYATQANGTTETASSALTTIVVDDNLELALRVNNASSAEYWWRKNGGSWSSATELTTNIPTSATIQSVSFGISNAAVATRTFLSHPSAYYIRL